MTAQPTPDLDEAAAAALKRACDHLIERQAAPGWWKGELRTNVTMDAEDLLLRQFLGILDTDKSGDSDDLAAAARWIRSQQRADGTWANFAGGPARCRRAARPA